MRGTVLLLQSTDVVGLMVTHIERTGWRLYSIQTVLQNLEHRRSRDSRSRLPL